jgi:hypothetical protein
MIIEDKNLVYDLILSHLLNIKYLLPARVLWRGDEIMSPDDQSRQKKVSS